jgi:hypothetical protein
MIMHILDPFTPDLPQHLAGAFDNSTFPHSLQYRQKQRR